MEKQWKQWQTLFISFYFFGSKISADGDCSHEIKRCLILGEKKAVTNLDSILKSIEKHYFADKGPPSHGCCFSSGHVWMWELEYKESWAQKNRWLWTVVFERTLKSLDSKEIKQVNPKGNQSLVFIRRTPNEVETPIPTWCKELTHWEKKPWCWEWLKAGEEHDRRWDGRMAWPTQ